MLKFIAFVLFVGRCLSSVAASANRHPACISWTLNQALDKLVTDEDIELSNGVKFVKVNERSENEDGRSVRDSVLSRVVRFFRDYELQLKLSDIFQRKQDMIDVLQKALNALNEMQEANDEVPRGKGHGGFGGGKKGGNGILVMATMMGGMMAALGYGALGMLVMKALTVSSMAFLLSAVIGLRRLLRRPDDVAGFGRISYIPVHTERRKKRSFHNTPYRAYLKHKPETKLGFLSLPVTRNL